MLIKWHDVRAGIGLGTSSAVAAAVAAAAAQTGSEDKHELS